jgi:hypothetical protein
VIAGELTFPVEAIDPGQALLRAARHRQGHRRVELDHGARLLVQQAGVERRDLLPVGGLRMPGLGVERGDRRLQLVRPAATPAERRLQGRQALGDRVALPAPAVLLLERHERAGGIDPGGPPRIVQEHQGEQALRFRLLGQQLDQQPAEADRLAAEVGANQAIGLGARVALVEDQVDDAEHGREPLGQQLARRHLERDARIEDLALGAHQPLRRGRLGLEEGAGDLPGRQAAQRAQRQRHLRRLGDRRMAAGEDEAKPIVLDRPGLGVGTGGVVASGAAMSGGSSL